MPAAKVLDVAEAVTQPIAQMRNMVEEVEKPQTGNKVRMLGNPFKYPESEPLAYPPMLGRSDAATCVTSAATATIASMPLPRAGGSIPARRGSLRPACVRAFNPSQVPRSGPGCRPNERR